MAWVIGIGISLALLFAFPRQFGIALVVLVTLIGGIFIYLKVDDKAKEGVEIRVTYDKAKCNQDKYPLFVEIYNGSRSTINGISYVITAHRPGHSNNIADYNVIDSGAILNQKDSHMYCVLLPNFNPYLGDSSSPEALVWGVEYIYPRFQ